MAGPLALGREQADSQSEQPRPGVPPKKASPQPAGNPLRPPEGWRSLGCTPEERPSWFANRQGREPRTGSCCLGHFPARRGEHPSPAHRTAWCRRLPHTWRGTQVESRNPRSALTAGAGLAGQHLAQHPSADPGDRPWAAGPSKHFLERSVSTSSTPQLTSGADRSWEETAREAAQILGGSPDPSTPAAAMPPPRAPAYPTPQPCTDLGPTRQRKLRPWAASERNCCSHAGGTQACCDRKPSPAAAGSSFGAGHTLRTTAPDGARPSEPPPPPPGSRPCPRQRQRWSKSKQVPLHIGCRLQTLRHTITPL